jgi:hypothetical protein
MRLTHALLQAAGTKKTKGTDSTAAKKGAVTKKK